VVGAVEAERAQRADVGAFLRRQDRLWESACSERAHLGETLQRGFARIGVL
jgi:hypothetical protein